MTTRKKKTPWKVLLAIVLGVIVGTMTGTTQGLWGYTFFDIFDLVGKLFVNALMLIVVPLVSSSIITGIARIGNDGAFGRLGLKIFGFYIGTSLLAILIGLFCVNVFDPGASFASPAHVHNLQDMSHVSEEISMQSRLTISSVILQIIPSNIVDAFHGQMLGLIFFCLLFGYALSRIEPHPLSILLGFWQGVFQTTLVITDVIMHFLPIGVFCLVAKSFAMTGLDSLRSLALFFSSPWFSASLSLCLGPFRYCLSSWAGSTL